MESCFKNKHEGFCFCPLYTHLSLESSQLSLGNKNVFTSKSYYITRRIMARKVSNKEEGGKVLAMNIASLIIANDI